MGSSERKKSMTYESWKGCRELELRRERELAPQSGLHAGRQAMSWSNQVFLLDGRDWIFCYIRKHCVTSCGSCVTAVAGIAGVVVASSTETSTVGQYLGRSDRVSGPLQLRESVLIASQEGTA